MLIIRVLGLQQLNKLAIYTALFGSYDSLPEPSKRILNCDYICFTDKFFESKIWDVRVVESLPYSNSGMNRFYKMNPHLFLSDYSHSLYIDSNVEIIRDPVPFLRTLDFDLLLQRHFARDCIYDEAFHVVLNGKANKQDVENWIGKLRSDNFPSHYGLSENNIIYRKHVADVISLMEEWWSFYKLGVTRDQLSLMYCLWKNESVNYSLTEELGRGSHMIRIYPHGHSSSFFGFIHSYVINNPDAIVSRFFLYLRHIYIGFKRHVF